jgi:hypothetical protein
MTVDEIVSAIRALPVPERLRVIERVAHEAASEVPSTEVTAASGRSNVTLVEQSGLLIVDAGETLPASAFDHRPDRDARADRLWGGS